MNTETYLSNNSIVANFLTEANATIKEYYDKNLPNLKFEELRIYIGSKFIKVVHQTTVWGFISRFDGEFKGAPIKKGDLLKPATWHAPAKHSRGNIGDRSAKYGVYGPNYM